MAKLPPPNSNTLIALQQAILDARTDAYDSVGIPASLAATDCDRALWYTFRWATQEQFTDAARLSTFDSGADVETRLLDDLEKIPDVTVVRFDPATGKQFKVYLAGGHVRGKLDGECIGLPEARDAWHVVECKSINDRGFKEVIKHGLAAAKPKHYAQLQLYMHARHRLHGLYLLRHRDSCATYVERVAYDGEFCVTLVDRLWRITQSADAPSRVAEDASKFPCVICQHKAVCHGDAFGRVSCRTCLFSTPFGDEIKRDEDGVHLAEWECETLRWPIDYGVQKRACALHRFIPAFVPGRQVDADDATGTVTYELKSGVTWVDGGAR